MSDVTQVSIPNRPEALTPSPYRYWGDRQPPQDRAEMFSFSRPENATGTDQAGADTAGNVATLRLYGPIDPYGGWFGISSADVARALDSLGDDVSEVRLRINSPGGDAWEGLAILNLLRAHSARVVAVVDGIAASAASYIAAGVDETVMSPGTQMMIHDASAFAFGPAATMRKAATFLDSISNSVASLYAEAAGGTDADWRTLMVDETWYTAQEAVDAGLADRVAVVPDAGKTTTSGDDELAEVAADPEVEDSFDLSIFMHAGRSHAPAPRALAHAAAPAPQTPAAATADGTQETPKEGSGTVAFSDESTAALRQKLGVADDADEATILAALGQALDERAEPQVLNNLPDGVVAIDSTVLADLKSAAELGRTAHERQETQARAAIVDAAIADGRIAPARRNAWLSRLTADPDEAQTLNSLEKGLVPVAEIGRADLDGDLTAESIDEAHDAQLAEMTGSPKGAFRG